VTTDIFLFGDSALHLSAYRNNSGQAFRSNLTMLEEANASTDVTGIFLSLFLSHTNN
jgi:hypothetical protein